MFFTKAKSPIKSMLIMQNMQAAGSRRADLAGYQAKMREPVKGNYRGYTLITSPPPSSGGLTVVNMLKHHGRL